MLIRTWPPRRAMARGAWLTFALVAACNGNDDTPPKDTGKEEMPAKPSDPRSANEAPELQITVAANDRMTPAPLDATPSPDGTRVYYTALSRSDDGEPAPGVFAVAASGGEISRLAAGEPFTAPVNISVSLDGKRLFVADPAASAVFTLPSSGGTPSALAGTEGYAPRGLSVTKERDGREYLYFTGRAPDSETPGLFRIEGGGGTVETVASGEPFTDPAGVVVNAAGVAYVVDSASDSANARVLRVDGGAASAFIEGIGIGFPAGITLTRDDKTVLVSGLDPETKRDVVYFVDASSKQIARLTETVGQFHEPAGLHRAHDADVFAWADTEANGGSVYMLMR